MTASVRYLSDEADRLVTKAAVTITRRRLLRNAGSAALGFTFGAAFFFSHTQVASAYGSCSTGPCGPSPLCSGTCNGYLCNSCRRRPWELDYCASPDTPNCWSEHCDTGNWIGTWNCCDCCCRDEDAPGGGLCSNNSWCPNATWGPVRKCVCRALI